MEWPEERTLRALLEIPHSGISLEVRERIELYVENPERYESLHNLAIYLQMPPSDAFEKREELADELSELVRVFWPQLLEMNAV